MTAHEVILKAGGTNIFTEGRAGKWLPVSWEAVLARDPEFVVVAHEYEPQPSKRPGWAAMSAVKAGRVHVFERDFFMFPTPRMAIGLEKLARVLHPEKW
jgi:iron complex transport system substrate-binding protein